MGIPVKQCKTCNCIFLGIDNIEYRKNGYCSKECDPKWMPARYKTKKKEKDWFQGFDNELLGNGSFNWNKP